MTHPLDPEAAELLTKLEPQEGPISPEVLADSREEAPDPELAGYPEPLAAVADLLLPLPQANIRVRLYRPVLDRPRPILLWLHGGGFVGGSLDDVDVACRGLALRSSFNVVSLDYRLAPEHPYPAALTDTYEALAWLRANGRALGGDGRLAAGGQSAGANLVAAAGLLARDRGKRLVEHQVLCYAALDHAHDSESRRLFDGVLFRRSRLEWNDAQYLAGAEPTEYAWPLLAESLAELPPTLVVTAGHDPFRDDGRRFASRLERDGVPVRHLEHPGTIHAFLNFPGALSVAWRAMDDIADDLRGAFAVAPGRPALQHATNAYDAERGDELRAFYGVVLGLEEISGPPAFADAGIVWFGAGEGQRELHFVPTDAGDASATHFCLAVDDVAAVASRLETAGMAVEWSDAIDTRPRFFCVDPFENLVEIAELRGPVG